MTRILYAACIASFLSAALAKAQGSIAGRVMSAEAKAPVAGADVIILGQGRQATTDSSGKYSLRDVKAGTLLLITRALGFRPDTARVDVSPDETISRDVLLQVSATTLGEVVVRDSAAPLVSAKLREFDERRRSAVGGRFLDSTMIRKWDARKTGDLLSTVPGADVVRRGSSAYVLGGRATPPLRPSARPVPCFMDVYLDGAPVALANTSFDVNSITLTNVAAIEVYSGPASTPARYNRTSRGCGLLLIWTR